MSELLAYKACPTKKEADILAAQLQEQGILAEVVKMPRMLDAVLIGTEYFDTYIVRINSEDFTQANAILDKAAQVDISDIATSDPLYNMSNEELKSIVAKPDEWGPANYNVALTLLKNRGITIMPGELVKMQEVRIDELSVKKSISPYFIFLGYLSAFLHVLVLVLKYRFSADTNYTWYFPGFFGLLLAAIILQSKTTLPDGRRMLTYNKDVIKQGFIILALNIAAWLINIVAFIFMFA